MFPYLCDKSFNYYVSKLCKYKLRVVNSISIQLHHFLVLVLARLKLIMRNVLENKITIQFVQRKPMLCQTICVKWNYCKHLGVRNNKLLFLFVSLSLWRRIVNLELRTTAKVNNMEESNFYDLKTFLVNIINDNRTNDVNIGNSDS